MPNHASARASERANQVCAHLSDELMSLASAYDEANKAFHKLWTRVYNEERKKIRAARNKDGYGIMPQ